MTQSHPCPLTHNVGGTVLPGEQCRSRRSLLLSFLGVQIAGEFFLPICCREEIKIHIRWGVLHILIYCSKITSEQEFSNRDRAVLIQRLYEYAQKDQQNDHTNCDSDSFTS